MKFSLVRNVKAPNRAHVTDAGIDFYVPQFDDKFENDIKQKNGSAWSGIYMGSDQSGKLISIGPGYRILIPSGVHVNVPEEYALIAFNKSGIAHNKGLVVGSCVVDQLYQGQVHISLINTGKTIQFIREGQKIVQFILVKIGSQMPQKVEFEQLYQIQSARGANGFGSTNKK